MSNQTIAIKRNPKLYCGSLETPPEGKTFGNPVYCARTGQIRHWGVEQISQPLASAYFLEKSIVPLERNFNKYTEKIEKLEVNIERLKELIERDENEPNELKKHYRKLEIHKRQYEKLKNKINDIMFVANETRGKLREAAAILIRMGVDFDKENDIKLEEASKPPKPKKPRKGYSQIPPNREQQLLKFKEKLEKQKQQSFENY